MENENVNLQEEILLLKKRVSILEGKENRRKAFGYFKIIVKIIVICCVIYGIFQGYNYVVNELPEIIKDKIADLNPLKNN